MSGHHDTSAVSSVGVFCGSSPGAHPEYVRTALEMGQLLGENKLRLVYGGGGRSKSGTLGIMGAVADGCLGAGGKVTGVIPTFLVGPESAHPGVQDMRRVETMAHRKDVLIGESDAFVILSGGIGTLDELFEVMTWNQLKIVRKPVVVVNTLGVFDGIAQWYERVVGDGFVPADGGGVPRFVETPASALDFLLGR